MVLEKSLHLPLVYLNAPAEIRTGTMAEFHKAAPLSRFMELRGYCRENKPIYGLFSGHYS
jgi:hypothetical protein